MKTFAESEDQQLPTPPLDWMTFDAVAEKTATEAAAAAAAEADGGKILPKLIVFDSAGAPVTTQDSRSEDRPAEEIDVPWREWHQSAPAQHLDAIVADTAAVAMILRSMHTTGGVSEAPVQVTWTGDRRRLRARAVKALNVGDLELPPCVPRGGKPHICSTHPSRVAISVTTRETAPVTPAASPSETAPVTLAAAPQSRTYYLHPEYKMPEDVTAASGPPLGSAPNTRLWKWLGDETMHPFWAVQRLSDTEMKARQQDSLLTARPRFNTTLQDKQFVVVTVGAMGGNSIVMTTEVTIPVLTNIVAVPEGEELFLETTTVKAAVGTKRKAAWKDDVAAVAKAKAAKPKPAAKPSAKASEV